jgi:hypothetical protein
LATMGAHAPGTERLLDSDDNGGGVHDGLFWKILPGVLGALMALVVMVPVVYWPYQWSLDDAKHPEYSVAVSSFSGLDSDRDLSSTRTTLDPTFDLTLRIVEPRKYSTACVERDSTATVSYRGVQLAQGPVPGFCGQNENVTEVGNVMAWGNAVVVPRFARDRLTEELRRGEAALDVTLTSPARYCRYCLQKEIHCKPRLGRGEASPPCWVTTEYPTLPDNRTRSRRHLTRRMLRFTGTL